MTHEVKMKVEVTLRHPTKEVDIDDLARAVLKLEQWYNKHHEYRLWFNAEKDRPS